MRVTYGGTTSSGGGGGPAPSALAPSTANKGMLALTTAADENLACAIPIAVTPTGYVGVIVNHVAYDPMAAGPCYFSGDGGVTPRAQGSIVAGDLLYWRGSVAGFQLDATTDRIGFIYSA